MRPGPLNYEPAMVWMLECRGAAAGGGGGANGSDAAGDALPTAVAAAPPRAFVRDEKNP